MDDDEEAARLQPPPAIEALWEAHRRGKTLRQVADMYGVPHSTVRFRLIRAGYPILTNTRGKPKLDHATIVAAWQRHRAGETVRSLAAEHQVGPDSLVRSWRLLGYSIVWPVPKRAALAVEDSWAEYRSGVTLATLSERYRVSISTLYRSWIARGLHRPQAAASLSPEGRRRRGRPSAASRKAS